MPLECFDGAKISYFFYISKLFRDFLAKSEERKQILHSSLFTFHLPQALSLQLSASRTAALVATLIVAALGDVLLARCSGSCLRVNLLPTHLVGELAAKLGGYGATQSALAVGSVQHLGGCHV